MTAYQFRVLTLGDLWHAAPVKNLIATIDEDFAQIDRLLRELRKRIARAAEAVHVAAEAAAKSPTRRSRKAAIKGRLKRR